MKRSILAATLLAIGFAWCSAAHAQDKQKPTADAINKPVAPVNKASPNIIGPSNKSAPASDAKSVKATPSVKPNPKSKATMGQGSAVMMKEKSEPPPPKKDKDGSGGPKDPKPKKDVMVKDKAALKVAPGQSQK